MDAFDEAVAAAEADAEARAANRPPKDAATEAAERMVECLSTSQVARALLMAQETLVDAANAKKGTRMSVVSVVFYTDDVGNEGYTSAVLGLATRTQLAAASEIVRRHAARITGEADEDEERHFGTAERVEDDDVQ